MPQLWRRIGRRPHTQQSRLALMQTTIAVHKLMQSWRGGVASLLGVGFNSRSDLRLLALRKSRAH